MAARDKVKSLKLKNMAGVIYGNEWIKMVEYDNENYSEEHQE